MSPNRASAPGLRLPFGKWVDDPAINELDIVAHQSFRKLLQAENVLRSFGLTDAVPAGDDTGQVVSGESAQDSALINGGSEAYSSETTTQSDPRPLSEDEADQATEVFIGGRSGVRARRIGDDTPGDITPPPEQLQRVKVSIRSKLSGQTFVFPRTTMRRDDRPFELVEITDDEIEAAAKAITTQSDRLERFALVADAVEKRILSRTRVQAEVESMLTSTEAVKAELFRQLFAQNGITQSEDNISYAKGRVIPHLVASAPVAEWTVKSMASAVASLTELVITKTKQYNRNLNVQVLFDPLALPIEEAYYLSPGETVLDQNQVDSRSQFAVRQHYGEWNVSMFTSESFDSYSGEFMLAELLDKSPKIAWWKRLYRHDQAYMAYTVKDRYFPDFAAYDTDGRLWIIEGKSEMGRSDDVVQAKKAAAESTIRRMNTHPEFAGKLYGYLIGYESTIASAESWSDLVELAKPAITRHYG